MEAEEALALVDRDELVGILRVATGEEPNDRPWEDTKWIPVAEAIMQAGWISRRSRRSEHDLFHGITSGDVAKIVELSAKIEAVRVEAEAWVNAPSGQMAPARGVGGRFLMVLDGTAANQHPAS